MRKISVVFVVLVWVCFSCEKDEDQKYSGEILLSSELLQSGQSYAYYGFTFEDGKITVYPPNSSVQPDLAVVYNDFTQEVILQSSNQIDAFYLNGSFSSASQAEAYFNSYLEVTAQGFQAQAENVEVNQVWTVKTAADKYAKIWIRDIQLKTGALSDYMELTIRYQFQPDGTKTFPA